MSFKCYLCTYKTSEIKHICNHLHNRHVLFDSSNLILKCCAGCPAVFKTFNGFRKHLKKCQELLNLPLNNEQSYDNEDFAFIFEDYDKSELNEDVDNFSYNNNQDIKENISNYVVNLYSLKLPELTITKILEAMSELIFPFLDNIVSIPNLDERQNLADRFKYSFESYLTKYGRNKFFDGNIVQPIRISHGIRFDKKYDSEAQCYKQIPVTSTFTYIPLLETLKVLLNNESIQKYFTGDIKINSTAYTHFVDGDVYKTNSFFQNNSNAIQLQLFFDEFEVCNPLGSKVFIKLERFILSLIIFLVILIQFLKIFIY